VPPAALRIEDIGNKLLDLGMCSACAGNAACFYVEKPASRTARLVRQALEGNPLAIKKLTESDSIAEGKEVER
jgi:hypothetical protein